MRAANHPAGADALMLRLRPSASMQQLRFTCGCALRASEGSSKADIIIRGRRLSVHGHADAIPGAMQPVMVQLVLPAYLCPGQVLSSNASKRIGHVPAASNCFVKLKLGPAAAPVTCHIMSPVDRQPVSCMAAARTHDSLCRAICKHQKPEDICFKGSVVQVT